ncbi:MAG: addiction module toxin, RelE/StbE family [uncultured bacterium]|nr:MAG: addiction module toxin, RelE/StbE family [uncultured bacterium]HLD44773.1 type II toxin-antitoxin system RelE/ParE family toxin [bacterium]
MIYSIELTRNAEKGFAQIMKAQPKIGARIASAIDELATAPKLGIPLKGELKGLFKYRVGSYRIIYQIVHSRLIITIIDIGHRKDVYR